MSNGTYPRIVQHRLRNQIVLAVVRARYVASSIAVTARGDTTLINCVAIFHIVAVCVIKNGMDDGSRRRLRARGRHARVGQVTSAAVTAAQRVTGKELCAAVV